MIPSAPLSDKINATDAPPRALRHCCLDLGRRTFNSYERNLHICVMKRGNTKPMRFRAKDWADMADEA